MMDIVFQGYPNIHGKSEHYEGGHITQQMEEDHFQNIKSRYLNTMRAQLLSQQKAGSQEADFIQGLKDARFEDLEGQIESQLTSVYNQVAGNIGNIYKSISVEIASGIKNQNQEKVVAALNKLIGLFKINNESMGLINEVNDNGLVPVSADLSELLGIGNLVTAVSRLESGELKYSANWINGLLTPSSEVLASYIDAMANNVADEEVLKYLQSAQLGTKSMKVTADFGRGGKKTIETKSADIKLSNISFNNTIRLDNDSVVSDIVLNVDSYATVKAYRTKSPTAKMISYAGGNAIAMNILHQIYGQSDFTDYQLYNTIAFHNKGIGDLATNYKIIRSDMVAVAAEKYIIGYSTEYAQRVLIHNYKAYPVLSILAAIAQQAQERTKNGGKYIGSAIFNISFDNIYKVKNEWKTGDGSPNELKLERVQETKAAIDNISTRGFLNFNQLNKFILSQNEDGISLKGIVPNIKGI